MIKKSILLIGMAGVGKSTVGKILAEKTQFEFIDLDLIISDQENTSIQSLIDRIGDDGFLELEEKTMLTLDIQDKVIAPGGSLVYCKKAMEKLRKESLIIYLKDTFKNIEVRLRNAKTRGIIEFKTLSLKEIFEKRHPLYEKYAHLTVNCERHNWNEISNTILTQLETIS